MNRSIGQEVFKTIVEMAYEMELADKVELWAVDRVTVALAVASPAKEKSAIRGNEKEIVLKRDSSKKQRHIIVYKNIPTGREVLHPSDEGWMGMVNEYEKQPFIIGSYKYSEKKEIYDDVCDYLLEQAKTDYTYEQLKTKAKVLYYATITYDFGGEERKYLLHKIYNLNM